MKFDELAEKMKAFERAHDSCVLPEMYIVARIDGRGFTRLTKETHSFERPYDARFSELMVQTTEHLMNCGFNIVFGYTQSDEISLLFHRDDDTFNRRSRKIVSVLAGEASAKFSVLLGDVGAFDCRISEFPSTQLVMDYFRWRNTDAHRNALNGYCYWTLRDKGESASSATNSLKNLTVTQKNELLFQERGLNFNDVESWKKRGIGLYWESFDKPAINPLTQQAVLSRRRCIRRDSELPVKLAYDDYLAKMLLNAG